MDYSKNDVPMHEKSPDKQMDEWDKKSWKGKRGPYGKLSKRKHQYKRIAHIDLYVAA